MSLHAVSKEPIKQLWGVKAGVWGCPGGGVGVSGRVCGGVRAGVWGCPGRVLTSLTSAWTVVLSAQD